MSNNVNTWVGVEDAAAITGRSVSTIRRWIGKIKQTNKGRVYVRESPFPDRGGYKILIMRQFLITEIGPHNEFNTHRFMNTYQAPVISHVGMGSDRVLMLECKVVELSEEMKMLERKVVEHSEEMKMMHEAISGLVLLLNSRQEQGVCGAPDYEQIPNGHCVYIEQDKGNDLVKIGFSKDPASRRGQLLGANPLLVNRGVFPGTVKDENALHRIFKKKRVSREWFRLNEEDIAFIHKYFDCSSEADCLGGLFDTPR